MAEEKQVVDRFVEAWDRVERELLKKDMSAYKVAVLEAEKIFLAVLEEKGFPGTDVESIIENNAESFANYDKLRYARAMHKKIVTKLGFDISQDDADEIISGYRGAIADLRRINLNESPFFERFSLMLRRKFYGFPQKTKGLVAALIALSLFTFFLTETETGRNASAAFVDANNYLFYKIVPAAFFLLLLAAALIVILYLYRNRKK